MFLDVCGVVLFFDDLYLSMFYVIFFFFKQKTAYELRISDWSSDVCSSDLPIGAAITLVMFALGVVVAVSLIRHARRYHHHRALQEQRLRTTMQIGRASCRERVCQYV